MLHISLEIIGCENLEELTTIAYTNKYHSGYCQIIQQQSALLLEHAFPPFLNIDKLVLQESARNVIAEISPWLELDSKDAEIRQNSETCVKQQLNWAIHLGLNHVSFRIPPGDFDNFSRVVSNSLTKISYQSILIRCRVSDWDKWNKIRMLANFSKKLMVCLELGNEIDHRWMAEPVKVVCFESNLFLKNQKGYPVLKKDIQEFCKSLFLSSPDVLISASFGDDNLKYYKEYIDHISNSLPPPSIIDEFAQGYHDYLQIPLQPLMDNLESATYQTFEKDPIKYQQYELAIYKALLDRGDSTIFVVGAGRGPLVDCSIRASKKSEKTVVIYAIEKNPNAILTLQARSKEWGPIVRVVHTDMRFWKPEEKCDILVSELLGSFGDNELSPECLDGCQHVIKEGGISIPCDYTSYVSPIASMKLFDQTSSYEDLTHMETPYVVKFRNIYEISKPKQLWSFKHPHTLYMNPPGHPSFNDHNARYAKETFEVAENTIMHGIAGYFDATLYKDVKISIHPESHSPEMFSWFPIYFPLHRPIFLQKGSSVDILMWRCTSSRKVWYEWSVTVKELNGEYSNAIHNVDGRSSWIGL